MNLDTYAPLMQLLLGNDFYLAYSLVSMLSESEKGKDTASALVSVFVQPNNAQFATVIGRIIDFEVEKCGGQEILVFRDSMSPAAKFLDVLLQRYASKFMKKTLQALQKKFVKSAPFLEVNPARVSDPELLARNISQVTQLAFDVLTQVFSAAKKFPLPIAYIISVLAEKLSAFTPRASANRTAVGTIVMLKLVGPLLCSSAGLASTLKKKGVDGVALTKGLITVAKILQTLANGGTYEPENYMSCFNEFIEQTSPVYDCFMDNILKIATKSAKIVDDMPPKRLLKDWNSVYHYLKLNMNAVLERCMMLDDLSVSTGGVDGLTGHQLADQLQQSITAVTAAKQQAELDSLGQVFM